MNIIESKINDNVAFVKNVSVNKGLADELLLRLRKTRYRDKENAVKRHRKRGRLLAHERIELLLDDAVPFLELSALAANGQYEDQFPSAGIITGIGIIQGREALIIANDASVKGGTYIKETIKKHIRALEIALRNKLPAVYLVDSGGIFLPEQVNVFADREHFGRIFFLQAQLSAASIPQIALVMGSCTAGGAYVPAMSSESIMVKNQGTIFLAGPPLVKAATGEDVTAEELGGAKVHTQISGVADHMAENDEDAIEICQRIFETLPETKKQIENSTLFEEPIYAVEELFGFTGIDTRSVTEVHQIIARIVDGSRFQEFKPLYGKTLITGFARIKGMKVGIVANQGILFPESAQKGTHFIELCNHRQIPIIFIQNITGFMVGKTYEHNGIVKEGAKMVQAVANAVVPKITLVVGGSYGAGNYAMSGRAFDPDFLFMWPNAKIGVMGGEQAANVLVTVKRQQAELSGDKPDENELQKLYDTTLKQYEQQNSCYYSTSHVWDDGIIHPFDTRNVLALALTITQNREIQKPSSGIYRM